jgi:hypothetical protein
LSLPLLLPVLFVFAVACSFVCHSAGQRMNLLSLLDVPSSFSSPIEAGAAVYASN